MTQQSPPSPANKLIERYNGVWSFSWSRKPTLSSVKLTSSPKQNAVGSMITKPERHDKMANPTENTPTDSFRRGEEEARHEKWDTATSTSAPSAPGEKHEKVANPTDNNPTDTRGERRAARQRGHIGINDSTRRKTQRRCGSKGYV